MNLSLVAVYVLAAVWIVTAVVLAIVGVVELPAAGWAIAGILAVGFIGRTAHHR